MLRKENRCVGCPDGIFCLGDSCSMRNAQVVYCDKCGDYAELSFEGEDYCSACFEDLLNSEYREKAILPDWDWWEQLSVSERLFVAFGAGEGDIERYEV